MANHRIVAGLIAVLVLAGCSGQAGGTDQQESDPVDQASVKPDGRSADAKTARLVKTGFGQADGYVWVTSLVENRSEANVGQFATVQFNLLDEDGEIIKSTEQVEQLSRAGQKLAVGTQVDLAKGEKPAKLEATLNVSDHSGIESEPFPEIETGKVKLEKEEYGSGWVGKFRS